MQNRRDFLVRSVGATAALAAASLVQTACAAPSEPAMIGYGVGQSLKPIVGPNQYGGISSSADYLGSWVLIDLCPWWCPPCTGSAVHHDEFARSVRSAGIDLRVLPTVLETLNHDPSQRSDADKWTAYFGLNSEIALHCNGDELSPLLRLSDDFAAANGSSIGSYPTYVLVDPNGIVRHYQASSELEMVQARLAEFTGTSLTDTWPLQSVSTPAFRLVEIASVAATGSLADGVVFDELFAFGSDGQHVSVGPVNWSLMAPTLATFSGAAYNLATPFAPDAPITAAIQAGAPPHGTRYSLIVDFTAPIAIVPDDAWMPDSMLGDVNAMGIDPGATAEIASTLQTVIAHLGAMRFAKASTAAQQLVTQALSSDAGFAFVGDAQLLVALLDEAAAGL